jgi:hypothetical protein
MFFGMMLANDPQEPEYNGMNAGNDVATLKRWRSRTQPRCDAATDRICTCRILVI